MTSRAEQDYLKAVFALGEYGDRVTIGLLASHLDVAQPSVSVMVKKLAARDLVVHQPQGDVALTSTGRLEALRVLRRHRLLEAFLSETLGFAWEEVHAEAEVLEHSVSERLTSRIAEHLHHPARDPHGDPIPSESGDYPTAPDPPLASAAPGSRVRIARVKDRHPEILERLAADGLVPGVELIVEGHDAFGGPLWVSTRFARHALGPALVDAIAVEILPPARRAR